MSFLGLSKFEKLIVYCSSLLFGRLNFWNSEEQWHFLKKSNTEVTKFVLKVFWSWFVNWHPQVAVYGSHRFAIQNNHLLIHYTSNVLNI